MNKLSQVSVLAGIIIFLATASILLIFVHNFITQASVEGELEACKFSMELAHTTKKINVPGKAGGSAFVALECPRRSLGDVVIKKDDIVVNDKIDQRKAHKIIADAMAKCWYMAGEGRIDPFSNWKENWQGKSICLDCKKISFDESLLEWMAEKQSKLIDETFDGKIDISKVRFDEESLKNLQQAIKSSMDDLSKDEKEKFLNSYLDFSITSPLKFLITEPMPKKKITYYEYLYGDKPTLNPTIQKQLEDQNAVVIPDSIIYLRMVRRDVNHWGWVALKFAGAAVAIIIFIIAAAELIAFIGIAKILSALGIVGTLFVGSLVVASAFGVSAAMILGTGINAFAHCPECDAVGGIALIHPEITPLSSTTDVCLKPTLEECKKDGYEKDVKICDLLVN